MRKLIILVVWLTLLLSMARAQEARLRDPFCQFTATSNMMLKMDIKSDVGLVSPYPKKKESKGVVIRLSGIIWDSIDPIAIINLNGKSYMMGTKKLIENRITITRIQQDCVILTSGRRSFTLYLGKELIL